MFSRLKTVDDVNDIPYWAQSWKEKKVRDTINQQLTLALNNLNIDYYN